MYRVGEAVTVVTVLPLLGVGLGCYLVTVVTLSLNGWRQRNGEGWRDLRLGQGGTTVTAETRFARKANKNSNVTVLPP